MLFVIVIVVLFTAISIVDIKYGACAYLAVRLLLPAFVRMVGINVSLNTFLSIVLFVACIIQLRGKMMPIITKNINYIKIIGFFSVLLAVCIPYGEVAPLKQVSALIQMIITEILPSICILLSIRNIQSFKYFLYTFLLCSIITSIYGIFSFIVGANPYFVYMMDHYGNFQDYQYDFSELAREKGGLAGYAAGMATGGPLKWSQIVLISSLFFVCFKSIINKKLYIFTICLLTLNCFLTGQRSAFLSLLLAFLYLNAKSINLKRILISVFLGTTFLIFLTSVPSLKRYEANIMSTILIWDDSYAKSSDIGGSSFKLRKEQAEATLNSLIESPLGKGQSFIKVYHEKYGSGVMRGFESVFFKVIWESGFIGIIAWSVLFVGSYRILPKNRFKSKGINAFYIGYITTIIFTGIQTTLYLFLLLNILIRIYFVTIVKRQL